VAHRRHLRDLRDPEAGSLRAVARRFGRLFLFHLRGDDRAGAPVCLADPLSWGRAFAALRDNPIRAESLGVNIVAYTLLAFAIGAAVPGSPEPNFAALVQFVDPSPFHLTASLIMLLMVIVGGSGRFFRADARRRAGRPAARNGLRFHERLVPGRLRTVLAR